MKNNKRKIIWRLFLMVFIGLPILFTLAIQIKAVQTKLVNEILHSYANKMGGEANIEGIYFSLISGLNIENLYIEDHNKDSLLYINELSVSIADIDFKNSKIYLNKVVLKNAYYNLYSINANEQTNMQFIFDYFSPSEKDSISNEFFLRANAISIENLRFDYLNYQPDSTEYGINFGDIEIYRLDLSAENFQIINDSIHVDLEKLAIKEKSGLNVENISGHAIICNSQISVENLVLKTPGSHIFSKYYGMNYKAWNEMGDFTNKVKLDLDLQLSSIELVDISYFAPQLKYFNISVYSKGKIFGKINNLKSDQFFISTGSSSQLSTKFRVRGLPNIDETFLSLDIKDLHLDFNDLETFLQKKDTIHFHKLPGVIKRLEDINYNGNITGFATDLVAYGTFKNKDGILETDLRYKYNPLNKSNLFMGFIETQNLNLSALNIQDTIFEKLSMESRINTTIDSVFNIKADVKGHIFSLGLNKYDYKNINFDANLAKNILVSNIEILDTNINMHLKSKIDFSRPETFFDFNCYLNHANLSNLKLIDKTRNSALAFDLDAEFTNIDLDKFRGNFKLNEITYSDKNIYLVSNDIELSSQIKGSHRIIDLQSDLLSAHLEGEFTSQHLINYFWKIKDQHIPALITEQKAKTTTNQNIEFDLIFKKNYSILKALYPDFLIADNTRISGNIDSRKDDFNILLSSDSCRFNGILGEKIYLSLKGNDKEIISDLNIASIDLSKEINIKQFNTQNTLHADSLNTYIGWYDSESNNQIAEIFSESAFYPSTIDSFCCDINLVPSYLFIEDSIWFINDAKIKIRNEQTSIQQFILNHNEQYLYADGAWQQSTNDSLKIYLNEIDLDYFPIIRENTNLNIQSIVNGEITLGYLEEKPWLNGYIIADSLRVNQQLLGDLQLNAEWEVNSKNLSLNLSNKIGSKNLESITADCIFDFETSKYKGSLVLNKQRLEFFQPFLDPYLSQTRGFISGRADFQGHSDTLTYNGSLNFLKTASTVNYLGTRYNFTDQVNFTESNINFNNLKIFQVDGKGDFALVNGYIEHHHFSNLEFFIIAHMNNFMALNTNQKDNELFYGIGFITGVTELSGSDKNIIIKVSGETQRNTKFYIPLSGTEEASSSNFISFVSEKQETDIKETYKADLSGIVLDFDLKVTPDAEVQLIFDQQVGDILKAKGNGLINLDINTLGTFSIFGDYTIEEGEYLFTLKNVLNKKFKIEKGGNIKWNGDPYQAYININAIYRLKTPLYDLTLDPEDKERIPVECHLNMKNSLTTPDITFDVKLPSSGDKAKALLSAMDEDEKNKQVLSLLVLRSFYTPDYLRGGEEVGSSNAVGKNASELLSNQLSNWLSRASDDFDIGVNYRPGDEISNDEVELALSTQLFNDRVAIDGNVGLGKYDNTSSNVIGTVNVDVKINKKGSVRIRGFNRANDNEFEHNSLYTQGVGLYYKEDFDSFGELLNKYWKIMSFQKKDSE